MKKQYIFANVYYINNVLNVLNWIKQYVWISSDSTLSMYAVWNAKVVNQPLRKELSDKWRNELNMAG